jgi:hypothetical protein
MDKIHEKITDPNEKVQILEILGKIIDRLKSRKTDEVEKKYSIDDTIKESFKKIKDDLEKN